MNKQENIDIFISKWKVKEIYSLIPFNYNNNEPYNLVFVSDEFKDNKKNVDIANEFYSIMGDSELLSYMDELLIDKYGQVVRLTSDNNSIDLSAYNKLII